MTLRILIIETNSYKLIRMLVKELESKFKTF